MHFLVPLLQALIVWRRPEIDKYQVWLILWAVLETLCFWDVCINLLGDNIGIEIYLDIEIDIDIFCKIYINESRSNAWLKIIDKNGHILPTGQWYAPSAVINDALIMQEEYAKACQSMQEYARVCQSMPEYARVYQSMP